MHEFKDKVVLVTGGSQGIGLDIADTFAKQAAKVIILNRSVEKGAAEAQAIIDSGHYLYKSSSSELNSGEIVFVICMFDIYLCDSASAVFDSSDHNI